jgi:prevent-host-death family protein
MEERAGRMSSYNVHEAKTNLSRLLQETTAGERVIIMRDGRPVAELIPYRARSRKRQLGFAAGQIEMSEGWDRPMTDAEAEAFTGGRL